MDRHYCKVKGYKRYPGRPVYYIAMSREEVQERRLLWVVIGGLITLVGGVMLWMNSLT